MVSYGGDALRLTSDPLTLYSLAVLVFNEVGGGGGGGGAEPSPYCTRVLVHADCSLLQTTSSICEDRCSIPY